MTTKSQMIETLVRNFKKSQNPNSKWYASDVKDFTMNVSKLSLKELEYRYNNSVAFNSKSFDKMVEKEETKLLKAGMYNVNKMKPINALD